MQLERSNKKNIGIADRILGIQIGKDTLEKIANKRKNRGQEKFCSAKFLCPKNIIRIDIKESKNKPHTMLQPDPIMTR